MPVRICMEPGCPEIVKRGRCAAHKRVFEVDRRERAKVYASRKWRFTRRKKLAEQPICELEYRGCMGLATEVHHAQALRTGGDPWAMGNLVSVCKSCHAVETRRGN